MREGLSREFPEAVRGAGWVRSRITVWREPIAWAALSGIGAGFLATVIAQALVGVASEASQAFNAALPLALFPAVTIAGIAAAAAVAFRAGGPLALALYLAYVAADIALALPGLMFFCERSGGTFPSPGPDRCTAFGLVASLWPQLIALGLGIGLARLVATRGQGVNSLLRVAGALALAQFALTRISGRRRAGRPRRRKRAGPRLRSRFCGRGGCGCGATAQGHPHRHDRRSHLATSVAHQPGSVRVPPVGADPA